jgi:hypothetical protein
MTCAKTFSITLLLSLACCALATQGQAPASIKAYYDKSDELLRKMDSAGLEKLTLASHTKDYTSTSLPDKTGNVTKRTAMDQVKALKPTFAIVQEFTKVATRFDHANVTADTVVLTVTSTIAASTKKMKSGTFHKFVVVGTSEDIWVKNGLAWQIKSTRVLSRNMTWDGRALPGN